MVSLGAPLENGEGMKHSPLVELNPNMLVRDVERMCNVHSLYLHVFKNVSCVMFNVLCVLFNVLCLMCNMLCDVWFMLCNV